MDLDYLFRYFRHENKYGLACIARKESRNSRGGGDDDAGSVTLLDHTQRGLRIKSVGILTSSIFHIQSYLQFLQTEAQFVKKKIFCCFVKIKF